METARPWKPQRWLDPRLAGAIAEAKNLTGLTWRQLAVLTGVSHPHLVNLAKGRRVPTDVTLENMADFMPIDPDALEELRQVAVPKRYW